MSSCLVIGSTGLVGKHLVKELQFSNDFDLIYVLVRKKHFTNTKKRNPMRRTTTPEDVAGTISMLLKPEADFINCSIIYCDGGEHRSGTI